jgi:hypothetical protein
MKEKNAGPWAAQVEERGREGKAPLRFAGVTSVYFHDNGILVVEQIGRKILFAPGAWINAVVTEEPPTDIEERTKELAGN